MPNSSYQIRADVIDIGLDVPQKEDIFFVDTNIWYWLTYSNASHTAQPYQLNDYPNYIASALTNTATLCYSELLLPELAHIIETTELKIFNVGRTPKLKGKEFRRLHPINRINIANEVKVVWEQVKGNAQPLALSLYEDIADRAISRFERQMVDGYDLFILEIMENENITKVITDDSDYVTVPNIQVFTANQSVLNEAGSQGKLITR
ncbi:MAG: PIN domain-containing protein [Pseudanabaena sp.]|jgi:hypothetical protein